MFISDEADLTHGQRPGVAKIVSSAQGQIRFGPAIGPGGQVHHKVKPLLIGQSGLTQCS